MKIGLRLIITFRFSTLKVDSSKLLVKLAFPNQGLTWGLMISNSLF